MTLRIRLIEVDDFSSNVLSGLNSIGELVTGSCEQNELRHIFDEFDVFWFRLKYRIDETVITSSSRCKYIITPVTGIDHIDLDLCRKYGIQVICLKNEFEFLKKVRATAEFTIAITFDIMRSVSMSIQSVKEGIWDRDRFRGNELYLKKVGIVGLGRLGNIVASYFKAFGCEVLAFDTKPIAEEDACQRAESLHELLKWSDIVSLHVDLNDTTIGLIGLEELKLIGANAFLINTSRGGVVNDKDLLTALKAQMIKGAAIDVLSGEPDIDRTHPLVDYVSRGNKNLIITPHLGGNTFESFEKTEKYVFDKLVELLKS